MNKRPMINYDQLTSLTADVAAPMPEAVQRAPAVPVPIEPALKPPVAKPKPSTESKRMAERVATADLTSLSFKVPPSFRRRFRQRAATADLRLNELLFEALDAWEKARKLDK
ncbi:hypothetical protein GobsT_13970 [Gemmata obscuriglobus]|uniref:Uncharacterized protein n=1 Tax=Gemmata obscuriglobus TaxID=114 RepID=A0A2Z3HB33_9BACT|nr:hypothetical protein [Gemmata obscuriglobus]AWM40165.1 hypothetical protein C1280_26285 [Gemmata obscuriglobus]QEG26652.1 hypothetical protein GobsT_13970 [Gemmata obscuriglobus]VTS02244.1 Uncharacterized protein OS=Acidiphilium multivorum (strain DSM 11245 / JCM 8867 / AIU301) GN=ACMV_P3_00600 PE=4 SV=1 [Gemmata obscuriglobus UQM 2246]